MNLCASMCAPPKSLLLVVEFLGTSILVDRILYSVHHHNSVAINYCYSISSGYNLIVLKSYCWLPIWLFDFINSYHKEKTEENRLYKQTSK